MPLDRLVGEDGAVRGEPTVLAAEGALHAVHHELDRLVVAPERPLVDRRRVGHVEEAVAPAEHRRGGESAGRPARAGPLHRWCHGRGPVEMSGGCQKPMSNAAVMRRVIGAVHESTRMKANWLPGSLMPVKFTSGSGPV